MKEAERLAQALDAWDGVLMMPKGWRERTSTLLRSQAAELEALTWKLRVATETLERCKRVSDAITDCWRVDTIELEALRKDAERYRWLRAEHLQHDPVCHLSWKLNGDRNCGEWVNTADLDAAIDAARK